MSRMTKPFNAIKSTLKADSAAMSASLRKAGATGTWGGAAKSIGGDIGASWKNGSWGHRAKMGGYGAVGAAGAYAAADFMNPWGIGWGD